MIEENVGVKKTAGTEDGAEAQKGRGEEEKASTVPNKFKDVDALVKAYEALEAEFTRRSQRLRALEKEAEESASREEASGAEKLRKAAEARRAESKQFNEFVAELDSATRERREATQKPSTQEEESLPNGSIEEGQANGEEKEGVATKRENPAQKTLFERAVEDEDVRLKIVGEYLSSLGKSGAPLTGGGVGVLATPPKKAANVKQAGDMALLYFRNAR